MLEDTFTLIILHLSLCFAEEQTVAAKANQLQLWQILRITRDGHKQQHLENETNLDWKS